MFISHKFQLIYFEVPRTGSNSVTRALNELDPESPTLAYNLARVYELMGEFERSAEYYALLIAITPEDDEQRQSAEAALERVRGAQAAVDAQAAEQEAAEARAERAAEAAREREAAEREQQVREEATREAEIASRRHGRADAAFFSMAAPPMI